MTIIIGIDPGSRMTGYGIIKSEGNQSSYLASGYLELKGKEIPSRLQEIFSGLQVIVAHHQPHEAAIEQVFMHQNPGSALKLGQARGAAIVSLGLGMPISEYSARQVKQSVVGYGAAKKEQVQQMVKRLLNLSKKLQADEADALAIALCHAHTRNSPALFKTQKSSVRRSSWRQYRPVL